MDNPILNRIAEGCLNCGISRERSCLAKRLIRPARRMKYFQNESKTACNSRNNVVI